MDTQGRAENALEQLLWAYALGKKQGRADPAPHSVRAGSDVAVTMKELSAMYQATCGIQPRRDELTKWVSQLDQILGQISG